MIDKSLNEGLQLKLIDLHVQIWDRVGAGENPVCRFGVRTSLMRPMIAV